MLPDYEGPIKSNNHVTRDITWVEFKSGILTSVGCYHRYMITTWEGGNNVLVDGFCVHHEVELNDAKWVCNQHNQAVVDTLRHLNNQD